MDYEDAKQLLLKHGSRTTDADGNAIFSSEGFMRMLRPFKGLNEDNFHSALQALYVVGDRLHAEETLDRDLASALWLICSTSRVWAIAPRGMLQRKKLISDKDTALLESWIDLLDSTFQYILNGHPPYFRISAYADYIIERGHWSNISFFVPHMVRFLENVDVVMDPTAVAIALGRIGDPARPALLALHAASKRGYPEWCNDEAQSAIKEAISQIERRGDSSGITSICPS